MERGEVGCAITLHSTSPFSIYSEVESETYLNTELG